MTYAEPWLEISIFGDEWMFLMQVLVQHGHHIEAYGWIRHEHGWDAYYALAPDDVRFREGFSDEDTEEDEDPDEAQRKVIARWLAKVPQDVHTRFPHVFDVGDTSEQEKAQ